MTSVGGVGGCSAVKVENCWMEGGQRGHWTIIYAQF